jgi:hypothetical protein
VTCSTFALAFCLALSASFTAADFGAMMTRLQQHYERESV